MKKRILALVLSAVMMMAMLPTMAVAAYTGTISMTIGSTTMQVNGYSTTIDAEGSKATLYNDYTMLPIRALVEAMGGTVSWNETTKQITLLYEGESVILTLGSKTALVNGKETTLAVAPYTDNGRTYVWLRTVEEFTGVSVTWDATSNTASVLYTSSSATVAGNTISMKIQNGTYNAIQEIALAPTGTSNYSANIMGTTNELLGSQSGTFSISIASGVYDLRVKDAYSNYYYYTGLDLTTVDTYAEVSLTSNAAYTLAIDGQPAFADRTASLYIANRTGKTISSVTYAQTGSWLWQDAYSIYIGNNNTGTVTISYSSAQPYYDLIVRFTDGTSSTYSGINLYYYSTGVLITLNSSGSWYYGNNYDTVEITFENESGEKIEELYFATGSSTSYFSDAEDMLSSNLKDGKSTTIDVDLGGKTTWYVRAYYDDGDEYFSGKISIDSDVSSFTLELDDDGDFTVSGQDTDDDDDDDDEFEIVVINASGETATLLVFVDVDDMEDIEDDGDDLDDIEDDYDVYDSGSIKNGVSKTFDVELDKNEEVGLMIFWGDADDDDEPDEFITLDFSSKISNYGLVILYGDDDVDVYDDYDLDDDERFVIVYNDSDYDLDEEDLVISSAGKENFKYELLTDDLDDGDVLVMIMDDDEYDDFDMMHDSEGEDDDDTYMIDDEDWEDCDFAMYFYIYQLDGSCKFYQI